MSFFLSVIISQISIYYYLGDFNKYELSKGSIPSKKSFKINRNTILELDMKDNTDFTKNSASITNDNKVILSRNLKHLEFINFLENHLSKDASEKMPLEFLNQITSIKKDVQLKTIEATQKLT